MRSPILGNVSEVKGEPVRISHPTNYVLYFHKCIIRSFRWHVLCSLTFVIIKCYAINFVFVQGAWHTPRSTRSPNIWLTTPPSWAHCQLSRGRYFWSTWGRPKNENHVRPLLLRPAKYQNRCIHHLMSVPYK